MTKKLTKIEATHLVQPYKKILSDARSFVNTVSLEGFSPSNYAKHLQGILERIVALQTSVRAASNAKTTFAPRSENPF